MKILFNENFHCMTTMLVTDEAECISVDNHIILFPHVEVNDLGLKAMSLATFLCFLFY